MNEQDKQLLLKDLCARLPYEVKVKTFNNVAKVIGIVNRKGVKRATNYIDVLTNEQTYPIEYIRPYLRPMSSMTKEEIIEFNNIPSTKNYTIVKDDLPWDVSNHKQIGWLNAHHFDYRGLIEKGLALVAPDNMYSNESK